MSSQTVSPLESTVEKHIDSTSKLVRQVDLALSLLIVISILLGGLFLAIIADHWLLKEGLSMSLRFGVFATLFAAAGLYIYWKVMPLFRYSINPVYTADLIERDVPKFKNSLINWLLLRQEREEREDVPHEKINDRMFDGIVRTAAGHVQTVPVGHAVDYHKLIWGSTIFAVLLLAFIAYAAFSPKNPLTSLARILFPVSTIERPQAAQFRNVFPGDTAVLQGEMLILSAEVISRSPEPVYLMFSTDDGQAVNQRIPMTQPEGKIAFETPFPPGRQGSERGFNSSVDYRIVQGESRSKQYRIDVLPAASVEIVSLLYDFPSYTGLPPKTVEHGGDIQTLEGTAVTVAVRSTLPLQEIGIVFDENPASRVAMTVTNQGTEAKGAFSLRTPFPYKTFSFQATDTNGNASRRSGIYRIEVIPDQPPKVQWADTAANLKDAARIDLPLNKTLPLPIQAEDPDFALRYLRFKTESPGKRIPDIQLLNSPTTGPTEHRGQINKTLVFSPEEKRLAVGETVEVWAEATDTKLPNANVSSTRKITINVIDPAEKEEDQKQEQEQKGESPQKNDKQEQNPNNSDQNQPEQNNPDQGNNPEKQEEQNPDEQKQEPNNPEQGEQEQNAGSNGSSGGGEQPEDQSGGSNQGKAGDERSDQEGNQSSEGPTDSGQQSDDSATQQNGAAQGNNQGGEPAAGASPDPDTQPGDAMEKIIEQMKNEGKFDEDGMQKQMQGAKTGQGTPLSGANSSLKNDNNQRLRSDELDPHSQNRRSTGNDPSNPKESANQSPKGGEQQNPSGKPNDKGEGNNQGTESQQPNEQGNSGAPQEGGQQGDAPQQESQGSRGDQSGGEQGGTPQQGDQSKGEGSPGQQSQGNPQQGDQGKGEGSPGQQSQGNPQQGTEQQNEGSGSPQGGTNGGSAGVEQDTVPDDPNLEYARQATNLVLEYLEDQLKEKPSDELLKKLGWSEDQLRQFYEKWKGMAEKSQQPQEDGKNAWLEALRSIGLRPSQSRPGLQRSSTPTDNRRSTEGQRFDPPPTMRDRVKMYNEGIEK